MATGSIPVVGIEKKQSTFAMLPDLSHLSLKDPPFDSPPTQPTSVVEVLATDAPKRCREKAEVGTPLRPSHSFVVDSAYDAMRAYTGNPGVEDLVETENGMVMSSRRPRVNEEVGVFPMKVSAVVDGDHVLFIQSAEPPNDAMTLKAQFKLVCDKCDGPQSIFRLEAIGVITSRDNSDLGEVVPFTNKQFNETLKSFAPQFVTDKTKMVPEWTPPLKFETTTTPRVTSLAEEVGKYRVGLNVVNPPYEGGRHNIWLKTLVTSAVCELLATTARQVTTQRYLAKKMAKQTPWWTTYFGQGTDEEDDTDGRYDSSDED